MGIPKLSKYIDEKCNSKPESLSQVSSSPCEIAIDSSIFLYRFIHNSDEISEYIYNIIKFIIKLKLLALEPIFVIDGKSGKEKSITQNKRRQQRLNIKEKIVKLQSKLDDKSDSDSDSESDLAIMQTIQKLTKKSSAITKRHVDLFKETLTMLGVTYFHCKGEADPMCAALVKKGIAKFCLTNDNDILVHGCNMTCQNFRFTNNQVSVYNLNQILKDFGITYDQFVDMCIILGNDYNQPIFGMTPAIALDCVKKYNNIETILNNIDEINNTIVKAHRQQSKDVKIKNLKRPNRKCPESFDYVRSRKLFKNEYNIKDNIQSTNLYDFTHEWINSNERLINLEKFLRSMANMEETEARINVQRINIIWSSMCYKRNTHMSQYCVSSENVPLARRFRGQV